MITWPSYDVILTLIKPRPSSYIHISLIRWSYHLRFNSIMSESTYDLPPVGVMAAAFFRDKESVLNSWSHWPTRSHHDVHELARCLNRWTQQDRLSGGERRQLPGAHSKRVQEKEVGLACGLRPAYEEPHGMKI